MSSAIAYDPLSQDEGDVVCSDHDKLDTRIEPNATKTWRFWLHNFSVTIILLCTVVDCCIILPMFSEKISFGFSKYKTSAELEMQSPYINLDNLYKNASFPRTQHKHILNHARAFYQVSSTKPNTVIPPYLDMRLSSIGMAPVYKRRLLLDSATSTMTQFRVMDFGFETCSLAVSIPPRNETTAVLSGFGGPPTIDIWSLPATSRALDFKHLTWANKPKGKVLLYSLPVEYGRTTETPKFHCPSMSYQIFEISCSSPECQVDIMGVGKGSSGLYMWQYQSI